MRPNPEPVQPGEESVWEYPRPPRWETCSRHIKVIAGDKQIIDTRTSKRVLETSHPPVYYIPYAEILPGVLLPTDKRSLCEFKGVARYYHVTVDDLHFEFAAWTYDQPTREFAALQDHYAFYAHLMDACYVDDQRVQPQSGYFYGGWITPHIKGPFKGPADTLDW